LASRGTSEPKGWLLMATAAVEVIQATDRQRGIACLTLAFSADPVMRWGWPDPHLYATYWPGFAEALGGRACNHGTAYGVEDCRLSPCGCGTASSLMNTR
jgi:hypothetical protein